jgi:hypothetical protein
MEIDKHKLRELASDPSKRTLDVLKALGFNNYASFSYNLDKDPELRRIFDEGRAGASGGATPAKMPAETVHKRRPRQARRSAPPPRKSRATKQRRTAKNGNGRVSSELIRKIAHEFEHIALYEQISDHFPEVAKELKAAL